MSLAVSVRKEGYRKATAALVATASILFRAEAVEELHEPVSGDTFLFFRCGSGLRDRCALNPLLPGGLFRCCLLWAAQQPRSSEPGTWPVTSLHGKLGDSWGKNHG